MLSMYCAPAPRTFSCRISCGADGSLFLLSPANSNSHGYEFTDARSQDGSERIDRTASGRHDDGWQALGDVAKRVLAKVKKERAGSGVKDSPPSRCRQLDAAGMGGNTPRRGKGAAESGEEDHPRQLSGTTREVARCRKVIK